MIPPGHFIRIKDWDKHYENNRSRALKDVAWIPIPNRHDGEGFSELIEHPDGAAHFGCWILLIQMASRCRIRGTLVRDSGRPLTVSSFVRRTGVLQEVWEASIPRFNDIGWIEYVPVVTPVGSKTCMTVPDSGTQVPDSGTLECRRERKKGREGKEGQSAGPPPLQHPPVDRNGHVDPSLPDVFDQLVGIWSKVGAVAEDSARVAFATTVNSPELLALIIQNTPGWTKVRRYADGFYDLGSFIRSKVWTRPAPVPSSKTESRIELAAARMGARSKTL